MTVITEDLFELNPIPNDNIYSVKLITGEYSGVKYNYNKCSVEEKNNTAILHFDYNIIENINKKYNIKDFEKYIGDILVYLIENYIQEEKLIYSGGVGEIEE